MINNNFLYGLADLSIGVSTNIPSHLALGSTNTTLSPGDTTTPGEFGSRIVLIKSRAGTVIKYVASRTSGSATSTAINNIGVWTSSSGGNLWAAMLIPSLVQTTNFDVDFETWTNLNGV